MSHSSSPSSSATMSPLDIHHQNNRHLIDRRVSSEGLPPIQLPPPIVHHFYIGPPPPHSQSSSLLQQHQQPSSWQFPHHHAYLPSTPPSSSSSSSISSSSSSSSSKSPSSHKESVRRSSHSAVEKRRRERMNDKIEKLKLLIPSCNARFPTTVQQPIHKLSVLQAAIDYIDELHHQLETSLPKDSPLLKDIAFMQKKKDIKSNN